MLKAAQNNRKLVDLLRTPLFLALALEAYQGAPEERISKRASSWSASIIDAYLTHAEGKIACSDSVDLGLRSWLPALASRLRRNREPIFYVDRLALNYISSGPQSLIDKVARRAGLLNALLVGTVITLVRLPYLEAMSRDSVLIAYLGMSVALVTILMIAVRRYGRRAVGNPLYGRRSRAKNVWFKIFRNWILGYFCVGSLASALDRMHAGSGLSMLGSWRRHVGMYPGWVLAGRTPKPTLRRSRNILAKRTGLC